MNHSIYWKILKEQKNTVVIPCVYSEYRNPAKGDCLPAQEGCMPLSRLYRRQRICYSFVALFFKNIFEILDKRMCSFFSGKR